MTTDGGDNPLRGVLPFLGAGALIVAWTAGAVLNLLAVGLLLHAAVGVVRRSIAGYRRQLRLGWLRQPLAREHRAQLVRCVVNWIFLAVIALVLHVSIVEVQLGDDYGLARLFSGACIVVAALLELVPLAPPRTASTVTTGLATMFLAVQLLMILRDPGDDAVLLATPMNEELVVIQGGASPLINHHYLTRAQRNAVDLVVVHDGRIHDDGAKNVYASPCFGQPVVAPAAGRIAGARDALDDQSPGNRDESHPVGNHVVIEIAPQRYVLLAHLRGGSVRVKAGDQVACGQPVAECGNSGNTTEPHLHIQVQDQPDISDDATTFPIKFRRVVRAGARAGVPLGVRRNDQLLPDTGCVR